MLEEKSKLMIKGKIYLYVKYDLLTYSKNYKNINQYNETIENK